MTNSQDALLNTSDFIPTTNRADPWAVLETLLHALTSITSVTQAVKATVESARAAVAADVAFWYSKQTGKASVLAGEGSYDIDRCAAFARKLLEKLSEEQEVLAWTNLKPSDSAPVAALLARAPRSSGSLVALRFSPREEFDGGDIKAVRLALKILLTQRAQSQAGTKQLLLGLLHSLTAVIDAKDPYTAGHSERVARISSLIGEKMGLSQSIVGDLYLAGLLHDIGKIGIPDAVLMKPGKLTTEEFDEVRQHPVIGDRIVASIKPFDRLRSAVRSHHERHDGTGYPDKLAGEAIPILARVISMADAVDAMMSPRRYRPALSPLAIDAVIERETGQQFAPDAAAAFLAVREKVYPPIYQKGIGDSAYHAIENIVESLTETGQIALPPGHQ
ncbi:MAG: HD-GYP domain-containing protein [Planctomycetia bacterium]|nr:HD-GYP domain-containing protein [Planctomycetia bacterium]